MEGQARLRRVVVAALTDIWQDLPAHNRENLDEWLSRALPAVRTAQNASVALTNAYIASAMDRGPLALDLSQLVGAGVRNGTPPQEVYERPFVTLWSKLGAGADFERASSAALARATGTATLDVQLSMRATADAIDDLDSNLYGYRRVANPAACAFCKQVDGAYVKASAGFAYALHSGCGCGLEPNTEPHRGAVELADGSEVRAYQFGPLNESVAVREHGEVGAVLVGAGERFTSLSDI